MSGIIFDLDGTLIDSAPDIHAALSTVFSEDGLEPLPFEQVRGFIGGGVPVLISRCIAAAEVEATRERHARLEARFREIYEGEIRLTTLFPHVSETLAKLKSDGFRLGLCTNKPEAATHAVLRHFGLGDLFDAVTWGEGDFAKKPDPAPLRHVIDQLDARHFLYVGDSETDAETAQRAGLPMALFTGGYRATPVEELYHDAAFDDFAELPAIVDRLCPRPE